MDPEKSGFQISDVVISVQGRDQGEWYYVVGLQEGYLRWPPREKQNSGCAKAEEAKARRESTSI